jgi:hypothetical protein
MWPRVHLKTTPLMQNGPLPPHTGARPDGSAGPRERVRALLDPATRTTALACVKEAAAMLKEAVIPTPENIDPGRRSGGLLERPHS